MSEVIAERFTYNLALQIHNSLYKFFSGDQNYSSWREFGVVWTHPPRRPTSTLSRAVRWTGLHTAEQERNNSHTLFDQPGVF